MAISFGTVHGMATQTTQHSLTSILTGLSYPAGSTMLVAGVMLANANGDAILVSDSQGNSYTVNYHYRSGGNKCVVFIAVAYLTNSLGSADSITIADTSNSSTNFTVLAAWFCGVTGCSSSPVDSSTTGANDGAATTTPTVTSGTPSQVNEAFVVMYGSPTTNTGTYTEDSNWTNLVNDGGYSSAPLVRYSAAYLINSGVGTEQHNPTTSNTAYTHLIVGLRPPIPPTTGGTLPMMGV